MIRHSGESRIFFCVVSLLFIMLVSCGKSKEPVTVSSPDGRIKAIVNPRGGQDGKTLTYDITFNGTPVVSNSPLGVLLRDGMTFSEGMNIVGIHEISFDETYSMPYGKTSEIRNKFNEVRINLTSPDGNRMDVIFRVYDDGAAFRYLFPKQETVSSFEITGELTAFNFIGDHPYWGLHLESYTTSYETDYTNSTLSNITPNELVGLPLLMKVNDKTWVAVTEANLTDYAGMYLRGDSASNTRLKADLSPLPDSSGVCVRAVAPFSTPWRVIMIGEKPGVLVESNIVLNLNDPSAIDESWIRPGRVAWDWWSGQVVKGMGFKGAMDNRTMKYYIDFAGDYGIEYMLVDAGWYGDHTDGNADITTCIPEIDITELVKYAENRGVGIIIWLNWKCVDRQMDEAFPLYRKWGVKGVKVDYMNRDDQEMVNYYHRVVKKAAQHKLLVDFHGAYKPTGIRRTYPNLITREGLMGLEYCKWSDRITPDYDCIIPFTRMLAGPMDYTPGGFSNATRAQFKDRFMEPMTQGTRCHQLALFVVFESPLQMLADHPANYRNRPGMDFIESVPVTWDDTKVILAQVGDYVSIARRIDDEWYLGSITDWTAREFDVPLTFLGEGDFVAEIYADGPGASIDAESLTKSEFIVNAETTINIKLATGGGHAVRFYPASGDVKLQRYK